MERFTKKRDPSGLYITVDDELVCSDYGIPFEKVVDKKVLQACDKLGKLEDIEEELGCSIEVRLKVDCDTKVYDEDGVEYNVDYIYQNKIVCHNGTCDDFGMDYEFDFYWKDYGKTWWLKEDRSE